MTLLLTLLLEQSELQVLEFQCYVKFASNSDVLLSTIITNRSYLEIEMSFNS